MWLKADPPGRAPRAGDARVPSALVGASQDAGDATAYLPVGMYLSSAVPTIGNPAAGAPKIWRIPG